MIARKTLVLSLGGVAVAGVVGTASVAMASSDSPSPTASATTTGTAAALSPSTPGAAHPGLRIGARFRVLRALHGDWVVNTKNNGTVTVTEARGEVTAVSPTAITITTADGVTSTFTVNSDTKVRVVGSGKAGSIGAVKTGDRAAAVGVKSGDSVTARVVLDGAK
jgi:hypothetical protein